MKKFTNPLIAILLICLLGLPILAISQDEFFKIKRETTALSASEQKKWEKLKTNKGFDDVSLVDFDDLFKKQLNGRVSFSLPKLSKRIDAQTLRMEYISPNEYQWFATTKDGLGSIVIKRSKDRYNGYISIPDEGEFEIMNIGESEPKHVLVKHNSAILKKGCGTSEKIHKNGRQSIADLKNARIAPCTGPIRILVLYTPEAVQETGLNPFDVASNAVSQ